MKKALLFLSLLFISFNCVSQALMKPGYFINNNGDTINGFIRDENWRTNPSQIEFSTHENFDPEPITLNSIREFSINNGPLYRRFTVNMDASRDEVAKLSTHMEPDFVEKTLLLKLILGGKASLYKYEEPSMLRFFFSFDDKNATQLIYKRYTFTTEQYEEITTSKTKIGVNNTYQSQLWNELKCITLTIEDAKSTSYNQDDLTHYFIKYNRCEKSEINMMSRNERGPINMNIRPGLNFSKTSLRNDDYSYGDASFPSSANLRVGIELEYNLQFNRRKWSIFIEPTYRHYQAQTTITRYHFFRPTVYKLSLDYQSIALPVGLRYFMYLNAASKLFIDAYLKMDFPIKSEYYFADDKDDKLFDIKRNKNIGLGVGYCLKNKYGIEFRYDFEKKLVKDPHWRSPYQNFSLILSYNPF